jgi:hypothetical protein
VSGETGPGNDTATLTAGCVSCLKENQASCAASVCDAYPSCDFTCLDPGDLNKDNINSYCTTHKARESLLLCAAWAGYCVDECISYSSPDIRTFAKYCPEDCTCGNGVCDSPPNGHEAAKCVDTLTADCKACLVTVSYCGCPPDNYNCLITSRCLDSAAHCGGSCGGYDPYCLECPEDCGGGS